MMLPSVWCVLQLILHSLEQLQWSQRGLEDLVCALAHGEAPKIMVQTQC